MWIGLQRWYPDSNLIVIVFEIRTTTTTTTTTPTTPTTTATTTTNNPKDYQV